MPTVERPPGRARTAAVLAPQPVASAKAAALRYVSDRGPGLRRRRAGTGFVYVDEEGRVVRDEATVARIRSLAIPPAWTDVWISPDPNGHLQAVGRDARGRKQYRYHPRWRQVRDETKYGRMVAFGNALPRVRAAVARDLAQTGLTRRRVLATIVRLLDTTYLRVGNEEYARTNESYGLTTLRGRHVEVRGETLRFRFRGKSGKVHDVQVSDRRVARVVRRCRDLPGQELFQYLDAAGAPQPVSSGDVNDYLREASGEDFTAKDFRTWAGTLLAASHLAGADRAISQRARKSAIARAVEAVAERLGNTPAVCRASYIHPAVLGAFLEAGDIERWQRASVRVRRKAGLRPEEAVLLRFLSGRLARAA